MTGLIRMPCMSIFWMQFEGNIQKVLINSNILSKSACLFTFNDVFVGELYTRGPSFFYIFLIKAISPKDGFIIFKWKMSITRP